MGPWDPAPPEPEAPEPKPKGRDSRARRLLLIVALIALVAFLAVYVVGARFSLREVTYDDHSVDRRSSSRFRRLSRSLPVRRRQNRRPGQTARW